MLKCGFPRSSPLLFLKLSMLSLLFALSCRLFRILAVIRPELESPSERWSQSKSELPSVRAFGLYLVESPSFISPLPPRSRFLPVHPPKKLPNWAVHWQTQATVLGWHPPFSPTRLSIAPSSHFLCRFFSAEDVRDRAVLDI